MDEHTAVVRQRNEARVQVKRLEQIHREVMIEGEAATIKRLRAQVEQLEKERAVWLKFYPYLSVMPEVDRELGEALAAREEEKSDD